MPSCPGTWIRVSTPSIAGAAERPHCLLPPRCLLPPHYFLFSISFQLAWPTSVLFLSTLSSKTGGEKQRGKKEVLALTVSPFASLGFGLAEPQLPRLL